MGPDFLPLSKASPFYSRIAVRDSAKWASNMCRLRILKFWHAPPDDVTVTPHITVISGTKMVLTALAFGFSIYATKGLKTSTQAFQSHSGEDCRGKFLLTSEWSACLRC